MRKRDKLKYLRKLRDTLHKCWCKGTLAETVDGSTTQPTAPNAAKYCLVGGVCYIFDLDEISEEISPLDSIHIIELLYNNLPKKYKYNNSNMQSCIIDFNDQDSTRKSDVIQFIDRCIKRVEGGNEKTR